jgi:hypothetical protein
LPLHTLNGSGKDTIFLNAGYKCLRRIRNGHFRIFRQF